MEVESQCLRLCIVSGKTARVRRVFGNVMLRALCGHMHTAPLTCGQRAAHCVSAEDMSVLFPE